MASIGWGNHDRIVAIRPAASRKICRVTHLRRPGRSGITPYPSNSKYPGRESKAPRLFVCETQANIEKLCYNPITSV